MAEQTYKLTQQIGTFGNGETLRVTAEHGSWHPFDLRLEPVEGAAIGSIERQREKLSHVI